ncbi:MAG: lysophospholipid acyltransferase family protein, partial [Desulfobacterales bacterium]
MKTAFPDRSVPRLSLQQSPQLIDPTTGLKSEVMRRLAAVIQPAVEPLLQLGRVNRCYDRYRATLKACKTPGEMFRDVLATLGVGYDVNPDERLNIPTRGPLVVVANHPFGGIEGVVLGAVLLEVRPDLRILANYLLKRVEGIGETIIPVDPFNTGGAVKQNRKGLKAAVAWLKAGGVLATFPAGEVAHFRWNKGRVVDPVWSPHVAVIARRTDATVLPVFFPGRNSLLFQLLGTLHPRLRTALLPREVMNKTGRRIRLFIGKPIPWQVMKKYDSDAALTNYLRSRTLFLRNRNIDNPRPRLRLPMPIAGASRPEPIAAPMAKADLLADLAGLPHAQCLISSGHLAVYIAWASQIPHLLNEIGRLREITFRDACEGTGK